MDGAGQYISFLVFDDQFHRYRLFLSEAHIALFVRDDLMLHDNQAGADGPLPTPQTRANNLPPPPPNTISACGSITPSEMEKPRLSENQKAPSHPALDPTLSTTGHLDHPAAGAGECGDVGCCGGYFGELWALKKKGVVVGWGRGRDCADRLCVLGEG